MMWLRSLSFLLSLTFVSHAMAMYGPQVDENDETSSTLQVHSPASTASPVKKEIEKIETLVENLRGINPVNFDYDKAWAFLKQQAPDYSFSPEKISNLYQSITLGAVGTEAYVWKAVLKEPHAGLKAGDAIAIRMVKKSSDKPLEEMCKSPRGFELLIRCSHLRNPKDKKVITEYFPNFYGVYYGPAMPESLVEGSYSEHMKEYKDWGYRYEEMEWVDTTFAKKLAQKWLIPNSVLFEFMYGEWAGTFFIGISVDDRKTRNYGLKITNYGRTYHLGEDHYYFPPGEMPVRLDLEGFAKYPHPTTKKFYPGSLFIDDAETQEGKSFLQELSKKENDLFSLFSKHFANHKKDSAWVEQNDPKARYYYLDQKHIDYEKSLPKG